MALSTAQDAPSKPMSSRRSRCRDGLADDLLEVDPGAGRDLAGDDDHAGLDQRFAGDAALWVLGEDRVEDGVGDLVGNLVRMSLGYGFRGKQKESLMDCHCWIFEGAHCTAMTALRPSAHKSIVTFAGRCRANTALAAPAKPRKCALANTIARFTITGRQAQKTSMSQQAMPPASRPGETSRTPSGRSPWMPYRPPTPDTPAPRWAWPTSRKSCGTIT